MLRSKGLLLLIGLMLYALTASVVQAAQCKKLVFNAYCLGGDIAELEKANEPAGKYLQGPRILLLYPDGDDVVLVQGFTGKIMSVSKISEPGTLPNYLNLRSSIEKRHGPGKDESDFPNGVHDLDNRATTIASGRGTAKHLWDSDDWKIILLWPSAESVTLWYLDKQLYDEYRSVNPEG